MDRDQLVRVAGVQHLLTSDHSSKNTNYNKTKTVIDTKNDPNEGRSKNGNGKTIKR